MKFGTGCKQSVIEKGSEINHVQACLFKLSLRQNCKMMHYGIILT